MKVTLIQPPGLALRAKEFGYLHHVYRRIMPPSLPRVAALLRNDAEVRIQDLRIQAPEREEVYKEFPWEGYTLEAVRVGAPFEAAEEAIRKSDAIGLTSHFTFESGIIADIIAYAKKVNPQGTMIIGGADAAARPEWYLQKGADLVFKGDADPKELGNLERRIINPQRQPLHKQALPALDFLEYLSQYTESHDATLPDGVPTPIGFPYLTRGCPRSCDFCEVGKSRFEAMDLQTAKRMLDHYQTSGIRTLDFMDDNLLLTVQTPKGRESLLSVFHEMRDKGFAWEFPNGLEIGKLMEGEKIDTDLVDSLFWTEVIDGQRKGAFRLYFPVETVERREKYAKLVPLKRQHPLIKYLSEKGISQIVLGTIIPPDADTMTFDAIEDFYTGIRREVDGKTNLRFGIFHLIPIGTFRSMSTKYTHPELWNFYTPTYDGKYFSAGELFRKRLELTRRIDTNNYDSMRKGGYKAI
ncbi:MAG: hypothetical protein ABIH34_04860 [Nanoarchaeota archaeon]